MARKVFFTLHRTQRIVDFEVFKFHSSRSSSINFSSGKLTPINTKDLCPQKLRNTYLYLCHSIKHCLVTGLTTLSSTVLLSFLPNLCTLHYSVSSSKASRKYSFNCWVNEFTAKYFLALSFSVLCYTPKQGSVLQKSGNISCFSNPTKILPELVTTDLPLTLENKLLFGY